MNLLHCNFSLSLGAHPQTSVQMWTRYEGGYEVQVRRVATVGYGSHERKVEVFRSYQEAYGYFYACVVAMMDTLKEKTIETY